ncbi:hypothetical protein [Providencia sp. PROV150]
MGYAPNRGKPNPSPQLTLRGKSLNKPGFWQVITTPSLAKPDS